MRLFSNILIYATFVGLIWQPLSFICAFKGEICPSNTASGDHREVYSVIEEREEEEEKEEDGGVVPK